MCASGHRAHLGPTSLGRGTARSASSRHDRGAHFHANPSLEPPLFRSAVFCFHQLDQFWPIFADRWPHLAGLGGRQMANIGQNWLEGGRTSAPRTACGQLLGNFGAIVGALRSSLWGAPGGAVAAPPDAFQRRSDAPAAPRLMASPRPTRSPHRRCIADPVESPMAADHRIATAHGTAATPWMAGASGICASRELAATHMGWPSHIAAARRVAAAQSPPGSRSPWDRTPRDRRNPWARRRHDERLFGKWGAIATRMRPSDIASGRTEQNIATSEPGGRAAPLCRRAGWRRGLVQHHHASR